MTGKTGVSLMTRKAEMKPDEREDREVGATGMLTDDREAGVADKPYLVARPRRV